jgi:hypothetical protein
MSFPTYVRVTDEVKPRREYSVVESAVDPEVHKVLDKPATEADGTPLPPKYTPESLAGSGQKATEKKES